MSILVTRPSPAADELVSSLCARGQVAWPFPLIKFTPGTQLDLLPARLSALQEGDLVFILSQHAIHYAQPALMRAEATWPASLNYYAIGRSTALVLHTVSGYDVVWPHEQENSEILIQLPELQAVAGKRALILRGNGGRELLAETLLNRGAQVEFIQCYQRCAKYYHGAEQGRRWRNQGIDTLVVTSGEMLQQLYSLFPEVDRDEWLLHCRLVVVSERLATLARALGWANICVAGAADNDALLRALNMG
ncbi:uroporphyrinogen-III synthase [Candidatus Erwinia dacicola]|uniref:Uroporphyrinogen-III synthase n=1 Tax=Candidatus Erwinia dacicola TaxID=252393 RepID=A0A1E7Z0F5_9GAMM|nr:uroporphyrinogen-III synthase [Candidatus Erwinia dacicola]NJD00095.1 uroporphyrinogen-III synthase [Candidatus Erwinia dacicola]NJD85995.1 uroporphyrinogen-III synthase [Candidatus Erwinia dacicola]OFC62270.1 uroporphyrinogen-III synthase [Candidatus Erwinia dacicola]RAP72554.1 uroporphyrinogen-III synthase HemD family protein [Candidatus Erwinia dacicola]